MLRGGVHALEHLTDENMTSSTTSTSTSTTSARDIPPSERLRVDGATAAGLMGCGYSTFFKRVRDGMYPRAGQDGLWSVRLLKECSDRLDGTAAVPGDQQQQHRASSPTTA